MAYDSFLLADAIRQQESGGDYDAVNPDSGAFGAYQFMPSTWADVAGRHGLGSNGSMVVDIGGGTTDVAILSLSGVVISQSLPIGSHSFDEAIMQYLEKTQHVAIGSHTAEELKILIGTALPDGRNLTADVRGRSTDTGLPAAVTVRSRDVYAALDEPLRRILQAVMSILEKAPPELAADIADHGIVLAGGGLLLDGLDRRIARETGMAAYLCDEPLLCVAAGAGKSLQVMNLLKDSFEDI